MIRYKVTDSELKAKISAKKSTWLDAASARTARLRTDSPLYVQYVGGQ